MSNHLKQQFNDTPPRSLLAFTYDLVQQPHIDREALPPGLRGAGGVVEWRHEIEWVSGEPPRWAQSILFSNGTEVKLHFCDVAVMEMASLLPPVPVGPGLALSSNVSRPA